MTSFRTPATALSMALALMLMAPSPPAAGQEAGVRISSVSFRVVGDIVQIYYDLEGTLNQVYTVRLYLRRESDPSFFYQPVLSTTAILLLLVGFQLLVVGLVADAVLRRIAQPQTLVPSRAVQPAVAVVGRPATRRTG